MIVTQQTSYEPITLVLASQDEAEALWEIANNALSPEKLSDKTLDFARRLSRWFRNEARLA